MAKSFHSLMYIRCYKGVLTLNNKIFFFYRSTNSKKILKTSKENLIFLKKKKLAIKDIKFCLRHLRKYILFFILMTYIFLICRYISRHETIFFILKLNTADFRYFLVLSRDLFLCWGLPLLLIDYIEPLLCLEFNFKFLLKHILKTPVKKKILFLIIFFTVITVSVKL